MADFGQNDEVVSTPAPAAPKASWGSEDEVVSRDVPSNFKEDRGAGEALVRGAATGIVPGVAGFSGFGAGLTLGTALAAKVVPPIAAINPVAGGIAGIGIPILSAFAGAAGASALVSTAQDAFHSYLDPEGFKRTKLAQQQHSTAYGVGNIVGGLAGTSYKTVAEVAGKILTKPSVQRGVSAGLNASMNAGMQAATKDHVDWTEVAAAAVAGVAAPGINPLGRTALGAGEKIGEKLIPKSYRDTSVPVVDPSATGETTNTLGTSKTDANKRVDTRMRETELSNDPRYKLREAAFFDTGDDTIIPQGTRHDDLLKKDPRLIQGFVTEDNKFLSRKEAAIVANTQHKHLLEQPIDFKEGLHTIDFGPHRMDVFKRPTYEGQPGSPIEVWKENHLKLSNEITAAEKQSDPNLWTPEQKQAWKEGDWEKFSRLRGYTEAEIQNYRKYLNSVKEGNTAHRWTLEDIQDYEIHGKSPVPKTIAYELGLRTDNYNNFIEDLEAQWAKVFDQEKKNEDTIDPSDTQALFNASKVTNTLRAKLHEAFKEAPKFESKGERQARLEQIHPGKRTAQEQQELGMLNNASASYPGGKHNRRVLDPEDTHALLYGVKNPIEALERVVAGGYASKGGILLAKMLLKNQGVKKANIVLDSKADPPYTGRNAKPGETISGEWDPATKTAYLYKSAGVSTLLHESVHAAIWNLQVEGKHPAAIALKDLFEKFKESIKDDANLSKTYGFVDEMEFVAEAFTNHHFRAILAARSIPGVSRTRSMWDEFKDAVYEGLGIQRDPSLTSALDEVINQGATLIERGFVTSNRTPKARPVVVAPPGATDQRPASKHSDEENRKAAEREGLTPRQYGIGIAHSTDMHFEFPEWRRFNLTGEGAMRFSAGLYGSTGEGVNEFYIQGAKEKAVATYLKSHPEERVEIEKFRKHWTELSTKVEDLKDKSRVPDHISRLKYYTELSFDQWVQMTRPRGYPVEKEQLTYSYKKFISEHLIKHTKENELFIKKRDAALKEMPSVKKQLDQVKENALAFDREVYAKAKAYTYHLTFKAQPEELIDWDSLTQSPSVIQAFEKLGVKQDPKAIEINEQFKNEQNWKGNLNEDGDTTFTLGDITATITKFNETAEPSGGFKYSVHQPPSGTTTYFDSSNKAKDYILKNTQHQLGANPKTGEGLYRELSRKFRPYHLLSSENLSSKELAHRGDVAASIALAENGVPGTVYNAVAGKEAEFRNYVIYDESRLLVNDVTAANKFTDYLHLAAEIEGISAAHSSPFRFERFNWIVNALRGEGHMAFSAGTYFSTGEDVNAHYIHMAKMHLIDKGHLGDQSFIKELRDDVDRLLFKASDAQNRYDESKQALAEYDANIGEMHASNIERDPSENIYTDYRRSTDRQIYKETKRLTANLERHERLFNEAKRKYGEGFQRFETELNKIKVPTYHTTIKATPEELLDWDSFIQSNIVTKAFENLGVRVSSGKQQLIEQYFNDPKNWKNTLKEDGNLTLDFNGSVYKISILEASFTPLGKEQIHSYVVENTGEVVPTLKKAKAALKEIMFFAEDAETATGKDLYRKLANKLRPKQQNELTEKQIDQIGEINASIALAKEGVVGNVFNAQGGKSKKERNYVVYDDSRIHIHAVTFASKSDPVAAMVPEKEGVPKKETGTIAEVLKGKAVRDAITGFDKEGIEEDARLKDAHDRVIRQIGEPRPNISAEENRIVLERLGKEASDILQKQTENNDKYQEFSLENSVDKVGEVIKNIGAPRVNIEAAQAQRDPSDTGFSLDPPAVKPASVRGPDPSDPTAPVTPDPDRYNPRKVTDEADLLTKGGELYKTKGADAAREFYTQYEQYKTTWAQPVKEVEDFVQININNKMADERIVSNNTAELKALAPNPESREVIATAIDAGNITSLHGPMREAADKYSGWMRDIGQRAAKEGVIKGLLENYVTHIVNWKDMPKSMGTLETFLTDVFGTKFEGESVGMTPTSKFGKERTMTTFTQLERALAYINERIAAAGRSDFRLEIKTKDIAEIYHQYASSMEKAIENKKLIEGVRTIRDVDGDLLVREVNKDSPLPRGWEMIKDRQFAGFAVHPDLAPALKFAFEAKSGDFLNAMYNVSQVVKRINVMASLFHAKSLMEVLNSAHTPIITPIKEMVLGPIDKLLGTEFSGIRKAINQFKEGGLGSSVDKWQREGLVLEIPGDVKQGVLTATGKFADSMIAKFGPKTRILESALSATEKYTLGVLDKITWDYLHTGGKLMTAEAYLSKAREKAIKKGVPFDETASRKEIANFVNKAFGGLNWFQEARSAQTEFGKRMAMAAYSPEGRKYLQIMLFAPDWTISTIKAFTSALPKGFNPTKWHPIEGIKGMHTPSTTADYARLYQFKTALTALTLVNGINLIVSGKPIWENKDPTRIEFPDGTSMQSMKHAMEPYHWIMDPAKTLSNKLGFLPKAAAIGLTGSEYASPYAPKLVDPSAAGRAVAISKQALPFQVSAAISAPEGEGAKRALLGTVGLPVYGQTKEQSKLKTKERYQAVQQRQREWKERERLRGYQ